MTGWDLLDEVAAHTVDILKLFGIVGLVSFIAGLVYALVT